MVRRLLRPLATLIFLAYGLYVLIYPITVIGPTEPLSQVRMVEASVSELLGLAVAGYGCCCGGVGVSRLNPGPSTPVVGVATAGSSKRQTIKGACNGGGC